MSTTLMHAPETIDGAQQAYRAAMANYPTGVAVVTTRSGSGEPVGLTVNSLASVSMDPLLLLWSIDNTVRSAAEFVRGTGFVVHLLGSHQSDTAISFATKGRSRFDRHDWSWSDRGCPILVGSAAVFECDLDRVVPAGDHTILIGQVRAISHTEQDALLYHRRTFRSATPSRDQ